MCSKTCGLDHECYQSVSWLTLRLKHSKFAAVSLLLNLLPSAWSGLSLPRLSKSSRVHHELVCCVSVNATATRENAISYDPEVLLT